MEKANGHMRVRLLPRAPIPPQIEEPTDYEAGLLSPEANQEMVEVKTRVCATSYKIRKVTMCINDFLGRWLVLIVFGFIFLTGYFAGGLSMIKKMVD